MEKPTSHKSKSKKSSPKSSKAHKKGKSDGNSYCFLFLHDLFLNENKLPIKDIYCLGPTCSMFLAELSRKLAHKKREEEEAPKNVVRKLISK